LADAGKAMPKGQLITTKPKTPLDAERLWKTAIDRGLMDPGMVIDCAEFLVASKEFKTAAELLKASLRGGVTPERWYQEALAIALEESQGSAEEIERAYTSAIDLEPKSPHAYLSVSKALNQIGDPDGAIRLCQVAAQLEPNVPEAYSTALAYADSPKATASYDVAAFAAGGLLAHDWPMDRGDLHKVAREHLLEAVRKLDAANKKGEAEKAAALLEEENRRDLVIELGWHGKDSDVDLRVTEPVGTVCSSVTPMTSGGGTLKDQAYDPADDVWTEAYAAGKAFNGTYKVKADYIGGEVQGDKVQVKVTHHKGTPDERAEYFTLSLKEKAEVEVKVAGGRRTELAVLPSPVDLAKYKSKSVQSEGGMNKLRALVAGAGQMSGGVGTPAKPALGEAALNANAPRVGEVSWSTRLGSERSVGMDMRSETTIRPDGKVEVKAIPVFDAVPKDARVKLDLIPGGE